MVGGTRLCLPRGPAPRLPGFRCTQNEAARDQAYQYGNQLVKEARHNRPMASHQPTIARFRHIVRRLGQDARRQGTAANSRRGGKFRRHRPGHSTGDPYADAA